MKISMLAGSGKKTVCSNRLPGIVILFYALALSAIPGGCSNKNDMPKSSQYSAIPEYERVLKHVVITLDWSATTLGLRETLLSSLPDYTEILLLLPKESASKIETELTNAHFGMKINLLPFDAQIEGSGSLHFIDQARPKLAEERIRKPLPIQYGTIWSQDLFEPVAAANGTIRLVAPPAHLCWWTAGSAGSGKPVSDNRYLEKLSAAGLEKHDIPVVFKGGNILIAEVGGEKIAICGGDILHESLQAREFIPNAVENENHIPEALRKALGVDRVFFAVKGSRQPKAMYHLDQAVIPLSDGVVALNRVRGAIPAGASARNAVSEASDWLGTFRKELTELGFRIIDIDTPAGNIIRCEYFVNAIPFTHAKTGRKTLLMPVFDDTSDSEAAEAARFNAKQFESAGYAVIPVFTRAGALKGGIHCLINVID